MTIRSSHDHTVTQSEIEDFEALLDASSLGSARVKANSEPLSDAALTRLQQHTAAVAASAATADGVETRPGQDTPPAQRSAPEASAHWPLLGALPSRGLQDGTLTAAEAAGGARALSRVGGDAADPVAFGCRWCAARCTGGPARWLRYPQRWERVCVRHGRWALDVEAN